MLNCIHKRNRYKVLCLKIIKEKEKMYEWIWWEMLKEEVKVCEKPVKAGGRKVKGKREKKLFGNLGYRYKRVIKRHYPGIKIPQVTMDNISSKKILLVFFQVVYNLLMIFTVYMFWNRFFNFDKEDMKEKDYVNVWSIKYNKTYNINLYIFIFSISITAFLKYIIGINIFDNLYIIIFTSLFIFIIFNLNSLYIVLKYFKK